MLDRKRLIQTGHTVFPKYHPEILPLLDFFRWVKMTGRNFVAGAAICRAGSLMKVLLSSMQNSFHISNTFYDRTVSGLGLRSLPGFSTFVDHPHTNSDKPFLPVLR